MYGYMMVNDVVLQLGNPTSTLGINDRAYNIKGRLVPLGITTQVTLGLKADEAVRIEIALFDRDSNTSDDVLCTLQENLVERDAEGWRSLNNRMERTGNPGEANCTFTIQLTVE
jgi:hypothetical protein